MIHDDVGRHLAAAGSFERAAVPMGLYLAWCANLQLLSPDLLDRADELVLRVRYRDVSGSELAVAGCGGVLADEHLSAEGQAFTARYYPRYYDALAAEFGAEPFAVRGDWASYDRIAPVLTRALMAFRGGAQAPAAGAAAAGGRRWWQVWR